jgi:hypothetical protein
MTSAARAGAKVKGAGSAGTLTIPTGSWRLNLGQLGSFSTRA